MSTSTFTVQACYHPSPYEEGGHHHQHQADNEEEDLIPPPPPPPPAYLDHHRHGPPSYEQHRLRSRHGLAEDYHCHQYSGRAPFREQQQQRQQGHHNHNHHYEDPHHGLPPPPSYSSTFSAKEEGPILPDPPEWTALRPPFPSAVSSHNRDRNYYFDNRATCNSSPSPSSSSFGYNILPPPAWRAMPPTSAPLLPPQAPPPLAHHHACGDRSSTSASTPPELTPIWCSDPESLQSNRDLLDSVGLNPEANYTSSALLWRCDPRILQHAFYDCSPSPQHPTPKVWSMPLDVEYSRRHQQQQELQEEDDTRSDPSSTRSSAQHDACAFHTQQKQQQQLKAQTHHVNSGSKVTIYLIGVDEVQSTALPVAAQLPPPFYKTNTNSSNQPQRSLNRTANCRIGGVNIDFPQPEIALANVVHFLTGVQMEEVEAFRARAGLGIARFVQKENNSANNKTSLRVLSVEASMAMLATIDDRLWMAPCTPEFTGFFYAPTDLAAAELRARIEVMVQKAASASSALASSAPTPLPTTTPSARINNKNSQLSTRNHHHRHDHDSTEEDHHQHQNQSRRRVILRFPRHFVNFSSWEVRSRRQEKKHDKKMQKEEERADGGQDGEAVEPDQANALQDCMSTKE